MIKGNIKERLKSYKECNGTFSLYYIISSIVIFAVCAAFITKKSDNSQIVGAIYWSIFSGVAALFHYKYNDYIISLNGVFNVACIFFFKFYYLPLIYILSYIIYIIIFKIRNPGKDGNINDEEDYIFNLANTIIVGVIINGMFNFLAGGNVHPLNTKLPILLIICAAEFLLSDLFIAIANWHNSDSKFIDLYTLFIKQLYIISLMNIPIELVIAVMYLDYGISGLILSSSYIFIYQYANHKESQLHEETDRSYTDVLTGVKNKKYYLEKVPAEFESTAAILFIDFNNFKQINDTYGHEIGDEVIILASNILKKATRDVDDIIRFGGDEFVIIVNNGTRQICKDIISRMIEASKKQHFIKKEIDLELHMCIGISLSPEEGSNKDGLFEKADKKLYKSKENKSQYIVSYTF